MQVPFDMDAWCIITACGVLAFTVDTQAILQRKVVFSGTVINYGLHGGRVPKLAGLPKPWVKEVFILVFSKHKARFFMLDKCILKVKILIL